MNNMKNKFYITLLSASLLALTSCSDFLDTLPDSRTEINSADKIGPLLVSAYPSSLPLLIGEISSDNVMDNGAQYDTNELIEKLYLWDTPNDNGYDTPYSIWQECYKAIASANLALEVIEELGSPNELNPQRGEALVCRAYSHFILANVFCMPYNPNTASSHLGIPYRTASGSSVYPENPERGTLQATFENIAKDLEAGLPLIKDGAYKVPKYHFNRKAANAFAARFYLYYQQWDKVIEHANLAIGNNPVNALRNWEADFSGVSLVDDVVNQYISEKKPANLLIAALKSQTPYATGPYGIYLRYGHGQGIYSNETIDIDGPWHWRGGLVMSNYIISVVQKNPFPKLSIHWEYIDKANGLGYPHTVNVAFSTDETLLCRAEAYILSKEHNYAKALEDINLWIERHSMLSQDTGSDLTEVDVNKFYNSLPYQPLIISKDRERSMKKKLNPEGFTVNPGTEENLIQLVLQLRRLETLQEGLRWFDLKRYGIEFAHNRAGDTPVVLTKDDPRRAIQLPQDVITAGMEPNPRN